jgi:hypothetical protein
MSGIPSSTEGQAPSGQPSESDGQAQPPQAGSGQQPSSQFSSVAEAEAAFQRAIKDRQEADREAQKLRQRLKQIEDSQKTDEQKRVERLQELEASHSTIEQERQQWRLERAVLSAAPTAGIDANLALRLIDLADVKFSAQGHPENIPDLLAKAIKTYNLTIGQSPASQSAPGQRPSIGASNPPRSSTSGAFVPSWDTITKLTRAQFDELNLDGSLTKWMMANPIRPYRR